MMDRGMGGLLLNFVAGIFKGDPGQHFIESCRSGGLHYPRQERG